MPLYTFEDLLTPRSHFDCKTKIYADLMDPEIVTPEGLQTPYSWQDGSLPTALVEVEANGLVELDRAAEVTLRSGFNDWAEGAALKEHSRQVYQNFPLEGRRSIIQVTLTDGGGGPWSFSSTSVSFSVGAGGTLFDGIPDPNNGQTQYTLSRNGSVRIFVQGHEVGGGAYNPAVGAIDTFARGALPGVSVTNAPGSQSVLGAQLGSDEEQTPALRRRNETKWATRGAGSPLAAYENWARGADVGVTRVAVLRNLNLLDPGTVTVLIAGDSGALPPATVQKVQKAISERQVGGPRIPGTARAVVQTVVDNVIAVSGKFFVEATLNQPSFRAQIEKNAVTFQSSLPIGGFISCERLLEVLTSIAGLSAGVILDVQDFRPNVDVTQRYNQAAVFDLTALQLISR